ncbi:carbohydrate ABC transporter substrate-binding protein, CUT1 family [Rathayibacter oskolensis]|uniref:Carbohydrate ABC transporter substrate-binding protein, CUT1 family n=1 Tax=Rathayibacter oskolensis TaxID=1891671 RepID=A0A1X7PEJ0_9MICO|nr:ABC transporter substrate-binding protein [Rathayibacter oskolensis]SMH48847.1 carbohydrate ABC transporter substrate-binding protein, CUT1 family [Rathayibacter oskolensis]
MTRKNSIVAGALLGAAALALTACSGGGGGAAAGASGQDGQGDVTGEIAIAWWGGDSRNQKTNAVIDLFEAANDGVTTDRQAGEFAGYFDKLNVQASSRSMPCAVQLQGRQVNDYTKNDLLLPLDPMIESGAISVDDIPEAVLDTGRGTDGNLYFLPYGAAYDAIGVNLTLAEQAGVEPLPDGYTWDDYTEWLTEASATLPEGSRAVDSSGGRPNYFIGWTLANGLSMFGDDGKLGFTEEDLTEYWTMWEEMRTSGVTETRERTAEEPTATDQGYFANGQLLSDTLPGNALTPASATLAGRGDAVITTFPYPSGEAGSGNALYPSGFAIPKTCDNVPTAAAFIDFFTNDPEAGSTFAADNGAPSNTVVLDALLADESLPETKKHELELFQEIVAQDPTSIVFPPGYQATFEASFKRAYEDVSFERKTIDEAVQTFFDEANASLGQ